MAAVERRVVTVAKTADEIVNNSAVWQDDDHLSWFAPANSMWAWTGGFKWQADFTDDIVWRWTLPAGATGVWEPDGAATKTNLSYSMTLFLKGDTSSSGTEMFTIINGLIIMGSTAGTAQLQWTQALQGATDTKMLKGSYIVARRTD